MKFNDKQKYENELQEKLDKAIKQEREKYKLELEQREKELNNVREQLRKINDDNANEDMKRAQRQAE